MDCQDAISRLVNNAGRRITEMLPSELTKKGSLLPVIVDVREEDEFLNGHISGAKHISRGVLEERIAQVAPDLTTPILVYCARGDRSALAADTLQNLGYPNVSSLKGRLQHWFESGGVVECVASMRRPRKGPSYRYA